MFSQYFGHYLLNKQLLSAEQLQEALSLQKTVHVKFGVLAVDEGYLTPVQVEEIHLKQKQIDKRFGEIAIDFGYLTESQVEQMLSTQKQSHLLLAQALVDLEYLSIEQFSTALNSYKREHSLSDEKFDAIKSGDIDALVKEMLKEHTSADTNNYVDYLSLFVKNMVRFIDDQVYIEVNKQPFHLENKCFVHQEIFGDHSLATGIAADEKVFLKLASKYAEEVLEELDELANASVGEFLNLHNGIYLVNMSNRDIKLNMKPQSTNDSASISKDNDLYVVNVHTNFGSFHLLMSDMRENVSLNLESNKKQLV